MKIHIITGSTREGRATNQVSAWVEKTARATQPDATWEVVDLKDYDMPLFDEALPPQGNQNRQLSGGVAAWVQKMGEADGFVFVTPEYNHSIPAALKNAVDYLDFQLAKKPVAIVSHGAVGGARANEHLRLVLNSNLGAVPIPEKVTLAAMPAFAEVFTDNHDLVEAHAGAQQPLEDMLGSLVWYVERLKSTKQ